MGKLRDGIIKRGTKWYYVVRVTDPETGVSKPRWVGGFATEGEAKAERDEARVKARRGEYVDRNRLTVAEYLDDWIEAHAVEIKPKTLAGYRDNIRVYIKPRIGGMRLQAVRPATLSKLYRDLLDSGGRGGRPLSQRTVDYVHAVLRKAFNDAVQVDEVLTSNPAERAKRPRRTRREPPGTVWDTSQLRTFLGVARRHRLYAFFHLAAFTGARRGELLNLRWSEVGLEERMVHFRTSADVIGGVRVEGTPKGGRSRAVPIDAGTVRVLREHRKRQLAAQLVAGAGWRGDEFVFTNDLGAPLYPDTVSQLMTKLIKAHNDAAATDSALPSARLHDLRHIHATTLLLAGTPVHVVAARLGHADPAITLRVYAHVIVEHASGVADRFASEVLVDVDDDPPDTEPPMATGSC